MGLSDNVTELGAHENMSVKEALGLVDRENLKDILIIGYDKDGDIVIRSSALTKRDTLWMIELAKRHIFGDT